MHPRQCQCQIRTIGSLWIPTTPNRRPRRGGYLLRGATGGARGDIVQEIIAIVRQVASGLPPEPPNSLDDGLPGG
jgi:hypothetical protein